MEIARAKYRSKRVLASNVTFVKLEISQDLISRNLTRYKITRNVLKRLLRFLHLVLHLSTPFSPSSPRSRIHFRGVLPREKSSRGSSDSPTLLLMERGVRIHRLRRNRGGSFIVHVQGLIFRPNARYSCSTIFAAGGGETFGKCIAATMGQNRTWNENFGRKDQVDEFSLSLSFDPPQFSLGVEAFKGFVHFAFNWTSCGRDFEFVSAMMVDFRVWRILGDANLYRYREWKEKTNRGSMINGKFTMEKESILYERVARIASWVIVEKFF